MGTKKDLSRSINKVLVTGGGGFVGKAIVKRLTALDIDVRVIGRNPYPELEKLGVECFVGNICDKEILDKATDGVDTVFHVAALAGIWGRWKDYFETNVEGTKNVIASCKTNNVSRIVYTSTPSVVFNRSNILNGNEDLNYASDFLCNYARSKVKAEQMVLAVNSKILLTCAIRPHLIWGPEDPHLLPRLIETGRKKMLKKVGDGLNLVDISYVDNVAHAHILAAENLASTKTASGKAYFISQGEPPVNLWNWINELFTQMNIPEIKSSVPFSVAFRVGGMLELVHKCFRPKTEPRMTRFLAEQLAKSHYFSISNAQKDLGYEPVVSSEEGMRRTVKWLKTL